MIADPVLGPRPDVETSWQVRVVRGGVIPYAPARRERAASRGSCDMMGWAKAGVRLACTLGGEEVDAH